MSLVFTILGCGSSGGVPRVGNNWGACDPDNPRNRRRRCAALVERFGPDGKTSVLIDTPPDIREQLIDAKVNWLDAVMFTHDHADHTHGIDDLRAITYARRSRLDCYFNPATLHSLTTRFSYCFKQPVDSGYPSILNAHELSPLAPVTVTGRGGDITLVPFEQVHGDIVSLGFRIGDLAYSPDVSDLPPESLIALEGLNIWILDALRYIPHPSHLTVQQALDWIGIVRPKRAVLTHMHIDLDHDRLAAELPDGVIPAYDGLRLEIG